jgi:hypothetical protein
LITRRARALVRSPDRVAQGPGVDVASLRSRTVQSVSLPVPHSRLPVRLAGLLAAWLLVALLVVLAIAADVPMSTRGWVLLLVLGPPAYAGGEWLAGRLFNRELGARISTARFSLPRIALATVLLLLVYVPLFWWWSRRPAG